MGQSGINKPLQFEDTFVDQQEDFQLSFISNSSFSSFTNPLTSTPVNNCRHPTNLVDISGASSPLAPPFTLADDSSSSDSIDQSRELHHMTEDPDSCDGMCTSHDNHETHPSQDDQDCLQPTPCHGIKLVGDNIDQTVNPTHTRSDRQSKTLNYFQMYAVKDRTDISNFSEEQPLVNPNAPIQELLPNDDDDHILLLNFTILISRVLVKHIPFFLNTSQMLLFSTFPISIPRKCQKNQL